MFSNFTMYLIPRLCGNKQLVMFQLTQKYQLLLYLYFLGLVPILTSGPRVILSLNQQIERHCAINPV